MELIYAEKIATELMNHYGLVGWEFHFSKTKNGLGSCSYPRKYKNNWNITGEIKGTSDEYIHYTASGKKKTKRAVCKISLSAYYVRGLDPADVDCLISTIKHEIAHALTPGHGHDSVFKRKCIEIGCIENKTTKRSKAKKIVPYKWEAACTNPNCNCVAGRYRKPKRLTGWLCGKCRFRLSAWEMVA